MGAMNTRDDATAQREAGERNGTGLMQSSALARAPWRAVRQARPLRVVHCTSRVNNRFAPVPSRGTVAASSDGFATGFPARWRFLSLVVVVRPTVLAPSLYASRDPSLKWRLPARQIERLALMEHR